MWLYLAISAVWLLCLRCGAYLTGVQSVPPLPHPPLLEAVRGVRISKAWLKKGPLGLAQKTPGPTTDSFTLLAHTGCIVPRSTQWRLPHRDIFCRDAWCIPLRLRCTEHSGDFPSSHIHIHIHMAKTIHQHVTQKQLQSATGEIKRKEANLVQLESIPSGQQRKTKVSEKHVWLSLSTQLACWLTHKETQGIDQRRRRPPQEEPGGRRNLLLHSQMYFWRDAQRMRGDPIDVITPWT